MHEHDQRVEADDGFLSRRHFAQAALATAGLFIAAPARAFQERQPLLELR